MISRLSLAKVAGNDPRLLSELGQAFTALDSAAEVSQSAAAATEAIDAATVITLSPNAAFGNERILQVIAPLRLVDTGKEVRISLTFSPVTPDGEQTLSNKTLVALKLSGVAGYADDVAAAAGGVPVGGVYQAGGVLRIRVA